MFDFFAPRVELPERPEGWTTTTTEPVLPGAHDIVEFPARGTFAETRLIYCRLCGASQSIGSGMTAPFPPCPATLPDLSPEIRAMLSAEWRKAADR